MTVVADYTYCISSGSIGSPPFTVDFTDTSEGTPDTWSWDFGDGESSNAQHPTHTYESAGPFTCTLLVGETTGSSSTISPTFVTRRTKSSAPSSGNPTTEYNDFIAAGWTTFGNEQSSHYTIQRSSGLYTYSADENTKKFDLTAHASATNIAYLQIRFADTTDTLDGIVELDPLAKFIVPSTPLNTFKFFTDVSAYLGGFTLQFKTKDKNYAALGTPAEGMRTGWVVTFRVIAQPVTSKDSTAKSITDLVNVLDFSASPRSGPNTLTANFTDLTPQTITTRSWRERVTGSGNPFVEFSTAEAPSKIFDKTAP